AAASRLCLTINFPDRHCGPDFTRISHGPRASGAANRRTGFEREYRDRPAQDFQPIAAGLVEGPRTVFAEEDPPHLPRLRLSRDFSLGRAAVALGHALPELREPRAPPAAAALSHRARDRPCDEKDP